MNNQSITSNHYAGMQLEIIDKNKTKASLFFVVFSFFDNVILSKDVKFDASIMN
jgi:hypothetical protein